MLATVSRVCQYLQEIYQGLQSNSSAPHKTHLTEATGLLSPKDPFLDAPYVSPARSQEAICGGGGGFGNRSRSSVVTTSGGQETASMFLLFPTAHSSREELLCGE